MRKPRLRPPKPPLPPGMLSNPVSQGGLGTPPDEELSNTALLSGALGEEARKMMAARRTVKRRGRGGS